MLPKLIYIIFIWVCGGALAFIALVIYIQILLELIK